MTNHGLARHATGGLGALVVILAGCGGAGSPRSGAAAHPEVPVVKAVPATVEAMSQTMELAGTVEPVRVARLSSPAEGPVEAISVREGDRVERGQLLLRVGRRRGIQARLAADRESLHRAVTERDRVERLVAEGALPREQEELARLELERVRAVAASSAELAWDHDVRAPWGGVVSRVPVNVGNFVAPRTILVEIYDPTSLVVRVSLPETVAMLVGQGGAATVALDAYPGRSFEGRLARLFPELDRRLRTRTAELALVDAPGLAPGMSARVRLEARRIENAVVVPAAAVRVSQDGKFGFVVVDGSVVRRVVTTGLEPEGRVQILAGIESGERVIVGGPPKLREGMKVQLAPAEIKGTGETSGSAVR